jgi:hypothetical protein
LNRMSTRKGWAKTASTVTKWKPKAESLPAPIVVGRLFFFQSAVLRYFNLGGKNENSIQQLLVVCFASEQFVYFHLTIH